MRGDVRLLSVKDQGETSSWDPYPDVPYVRAGFDDLYGVCKRLLDSPDEIRRTGTECHQAFREHHPMEVYLAEVMKNLPEACHA